MKKIFVVLVAGMLVCGFSAPTFAKGKKTKAYGKEFKAKQAMTVAEFNEAMYSKDEADVTVTGEIAQVCQAEGCWLKLKNEKGEDILVKFKDHAFLVPKDMKGKVVVNGKAVRKTVSVDERKHMAEDAGASEDEIAKITEPKQELRIDATGLIAEMQ
jgi:uncharacterized protein YdeI (BOF family)